ncbi:amphiregulin isoform X2 [Physeter macrocephalus]|uniref:Amphiregulin isoform X2 n=1 Tax=Physeter macrocephalus TaxID=9755 RepID=A0A9W2WRF4_PHYMC|nr:amphiregulin isoform X2 [Physeter catodon]
MTAPLLPPVPVVLSLLIFGSAHYTAGLDVNDTYSGKGEPLSGDHTADGVEVTSRNQMSLGIEQVVKPKKDKTESEKTSDKPKRKKKGGKSGKNRRNRKKKNPCDAEFQNFCIHGECKFIEHLETVSCQCHQDYFGERCGEKSMKIHSMADSDLSKIALAAIAAFVSAMSFTAIAVVITLLLRKRYFREYEGAAEERKKLQQENGNAHAIA